MNTISVIILVVAVVVIIIIIIIIITHDILDQINYCKIKNIAHRRRHKRDTYERARQA